MPRPLVQRELDNEISLPLGKGRWSANREQFEQEVTNVGMALSTRQRQLCRPVIVCAWCTLTPAPPTDSCRSAGPSTDRATSQTIPRWRVRRLLAMRHLTGRPLGEAGAAAVYLSATSPSSKRRRTWVFSEFYGDDLVVQCSTFIGTMDSGRRRLFSELELCCPCRRIDGKHYAWIDSRHTF